jgi:hypothetical protein
MVYCSEPDLVPGRRADCSALHYLLHIGPGALGVGSTLASDTRTMGAVATPYKQCTVSGGLSDDIR